MMDQLCNGGNREVDMPRIPADLTVNKRPQGRRKIDNWGGGGIFIYSCSQTVKTIDFKI